MICTPCGRDYPPEELTTKRGKPAPLCKPCNAEKARRWRAAHPGYDPRRDRDARRAYMREYQRNYPSKPASPEYYAERYQANREKYLANGRAWRKANPDKARQINARRRARKLGAFVEDVLPSRVLDMAGGRCGICGDPVDPLNFHVDHIIPLARGGAHSYENTQPAHPTCNLRKWAKLLEAA